MVVCVCNNITDNDIRVSVGFNPDIKVKDIYKGAGGSASKPCSFCPSIIRKQIEAVKNGTGSEKV